MILVQELCERILSYEILHVLESLNELHTVFLTEWKIYKKWIAVVKFGVYQCSAYCCSSIKTEIWPNSGLCYFCNVLMKVKILVKDYAKISNRGRWYNFYTIWQVQIWIIQFRELLLGTEYDTSYLRRI